MVAELGVSSIWSGVDVSSWVSSWYYWQSFPGEHLSACLAPFPGCVSLSPQGNPVHYVVLSCSRSQGPERESGSCTDAQQTVGFDP